MDTNEISDLFLARLVRVFFGEGKTLLEWTVSEEWGTLNLKLQNAQGAVFKVEFRPTAKTLFGQSVSLPCKPLS